MNLLKYGSRGAEVELLQLGLRRTGLGPVAIDGAFGSETREALIRFQRSQGIAPDGVFGSRSQAALTPWFTGSVIHTVARGDTLFRLASRYGSTIRAIETANPGVEPLDLRPGTQLTVPLAFPVVPTDISWCSELVRYCVTGLAERYPFLVRGSIGRSVMGRQLYSLTLGEGRRRVLYVAGFHANEWLTVPILLKFTEQLAAARATGGKLRGIAAEEILSAASITLVACLNPDGVDLVNSALSPGRYYDRALEIAADFPQIVFPLGWKANISGVDLNLQYPAGWEEAKRIKYAQGYTRPAPRDFVGTEPLSAPESRAIFDLTKRLDPALILALHTQGRVIYWRYLDFDPPGARALGECFAAASGYALETTPYASGFAGFKDWFIAAYNRPGYTIECGLGENPLPLSQFERMYMEALGILVFAALGGC